MSRLTALLEKIKNMMASMKAEVPIKSIGKERICNEGIPTWTIYIWELILEHLMNGKPPSMIKNNIVADVKKFCR